MADNNTNNKPSWRNRRRVLFLTLLFCAFCIAFVMVTGMDTQVAETIVLGAFALAGANVTAYIGFATHQDVKLFKKDINNGN